MNDNSPARSVATQHADFTIERHYAAPPSLVFSAWADIEAKAKWFIGPPDRWQLVERKLDFRVGGRERLVGKFPDGLHTFYDAVYFDIVPDRRIVLTYSMRLNERHISVSMATIAFEAAKAGTLMRYTEQMVLLDGYEDNGNRRHGTNEHFDRIEAFLTASLRAG